MNESLRTRLLRLRLNAHPAYWGTGARLTYLADDFREVRLKLPLTWRTRNLVGTLFGGSMFATLDPIYMVMLMRNLGPEYVVWDKAATIRFLKPGREALYARCRLSAAEIDSIRAELETEASTERTYVAELKSREGVVHAVVEKTLHFRRKPPVRPLRTRPLTRPTFSGAS
jgi:acyl-coenzyme A thioesterase PaaI-like protein